MPKKKLETADIKSDEPQATATVEDLDAKIDAALATEFESVEILDEAGNHVRTYSLADHGVDFMDLADQCIAGHPKFHKA